MERTRQDKQLSFQNQKRKNYFEGWYFKQVSADESHILSIIPSMMRTDSEEKALLQIIIAENNNGEWKILTKRFDFLMSDFQYTDNPFSLRIGDNCFSEDGISLNLRDDVNENDSNLNITCEISFGSYTKLPTTAISPTIMGPFSYLPFMECIHGIGSLHHTLKGTLKINGKHVSFDGGIGYLEKDWGQSFPKSYVWLQSNHFNRRPSCLFFSWADIPLGPLQFKGFICHLWIEGKHYRFATYNGASCTIKEMKEDKVEVSLKKGKYNLRIIGTVDIKVALSAPKHGQMDHQIKEGLTGTIEFCLENEATSEVIQDFSSLSGVEIVPKLIKKNRLVHK